MKTTKAMGLVVGLLCAALMGCGEDVSSDTGSGGGGNGGGAGGAGGGTGGGGGGTGGAGGGNGTCTTESLCGSAGACVFPEGSCAPGSQGLCQPGFTCDGPPSGPVCGCDGQVVEGEYAECTFWGNSEPYSGPELCAQGTFACGNLQCTRHVQVCVATSGGPAGSETTYDCVAVADVAGWCAHGIGDCSCLDLAALGCSDASCCASDADHQETVSLFLP